MKTLVKIMLSTSIAMTFLIQDSSAKSIFPIVGMAQPIAATADSWESGFTLGINFPLKNTRHGDWSIISSYQQFRPNAEEMLKTGGREMKIESSEGISRQFELGILGEKSIWATKGERFSFALQYGAGIFLIDDDDIHIKGAYQTTSAAVVREIFKAGDFVAVPGITAGCAMNTRWGATLNVGVKHLFTAENARDFLLIGIGLQPK